MTTYTRYYEDPTKLTYEDLNLIRAALEFWEAAEPTPKNLEESIRVRAKVRRLQVRLEDEVLPEDPA